MSISEKTFLVTGAGTGIGYSIADRLITLGAKVILHCNSHIGSAQELASKAKTNCVVIQKDLSQPQAGQQLVEEVLNLGYALDGVVNNAAIMTELSLDDNPSVWEEKWLKTLQVNLIAVSSITRRAIEHFKSKGGGIIVNISSRAAHRGDTPEYIHYAASKAALSNLTKSIARNFAADGILAYSICPGFVDTEMAVEFTQNYPLSQIVSGIPLQRIAQPEEIAAMVVFLLSGQVPSATGTNIDINGASYVRA
ncbi:MAG: SDR family oxidoreductase [Moorea sp. SIOASIH]|uniref:SDR family NAD(P)-dependent oxidoreductase n=1 Tax=Moorena sp. SIOASIH TaxID=2607817 RepID=UPI0013BD493B|nr:SDR family oxidoreductase [Moorena sp. SIOASIH]NEO35056.1 SDR family oxidoreductase [Moorena sp. SIOASIH]